MTDSEWSSRLINVVAAQIKHYRQERKLSAQQVADACTNDYGLPMKRSVLANLESGRRPTLSLMELLVLAKILRVPPLLLVFPVGREETSEVLPGLTADTWDAAMWFTGEQPLVVDWDAEHSAARVADMDTWENNAAQLYREHDRLLNEFHNAMSSTAAALVRAEAATDENLRAGHVGVADAERRRTGEYMRALVAHRVLLRRKGLILPALPPDLADIDGHPGPDSV